MTLQPAVFGEQYYTVTTFIMLGALLSGIFFFCYTVFGRIFKADRYSTGTIAASAAILCTQFVPVPNEAFYWFNGSLFYTFYFGIALIAYSLILRYTMAERRSVAAGAGIALLLVFIGGGNYVTALLTAELLVMATAFLALKRNSKWKDLLTFLGIFMAAFLVSAFAPGNAVRQALYPDHMGAVQAVLSCFTKAASDVVKWTKLPLVAMLVFLVPVAGGVCLKTECRFGYPALVSAFSFCLLSSMYCPPMYAMGTLPWRITDVIFLAYVLLAVLNVFYWTGWSLRRYEKLQRELHGIKVWFVLVVLVVFAAGTALVVGQSNVTSAYAALSIYNGGARSYYETAQERLSVLKDDNVKVVELKPFEYRPSVLFHSDVSENSDEARNLSVREYYDKDRVYLAVAYDSYWED